ncbi:MAG: hypothetical protein II034_08885 [Muribaculaceae bacterium]|nr:hypothetical protein [Muribaculaceae bacterium]
MSKMKHYLQLTVVAVAVIAASCSTQRNQSLTLPNGEYTYNLPCRVVNLNTDQPGRAMLVVWLHGGVHDQAKHDLFTKNHLDMCAADDSIVHYLDRHKIKAIALMPICHKASLPTCVTWKDCAGEVRHIINDYVSKGIVDPERIYVAGSSDGGDGAWDYAADLGDVFAAAIAMSSETPRMTSTPVYFFNTASEPDCTAAVDSLKRKGCNVTYKHCPQYRHGGDAAECTDQLLTHFFSNTLHHRHNLNMP